MFLSCSWFFVRFIVRLLLLFFFVILSLVVLSLQEKQRSFLKLQTFFVKDGMECVVGVCLQWKIRYIIQFTEGYFIHHKNKVRHVISKLDLVLFVSLFLQTNFAVHTRCILTRLREESRTPGVWICTLQQDAFVHSSLDLARWWAPEGALTQL